MLEVIEEKIKNLSSKEEKINTIREFLQILVLKVLKDRNVFMNVAFVGGTALRILYKLKRYSEDLDFSLIQKNDYDFLDLLEKLRKELELHNLQIDLKYKIGIVDNSFIRFKNVLQYFDLTKLKDEKLSVKIEIDTNPPKGAILDEKIINDYFIFNLKTYDLSSLMAGKLHAVLLRKYSKGRDFYDLLWYLTKQVSPNIKLLNNAIIQTQKKDWNITEKNWKEHLLKALNSLDFKKIQKDVSPFLIDSSESELIKLNTFEKLLSGNSGL